MKIIYVWCAIVLQLSIILMMVDTLHAAPDTPSVITVRDKVLAQNVEAVGFNVSSVTGGTNLLTNNFIWGSGMEPAVMRYLVRVERAGSGWIEWDASLGGVHMWDQVATTFGDGATVRLYRIVDSNNQPLSYSGHSDLNDPAGAHHVVFLGETTVPAGGWVSEGSSAGSVNRVHFADTDIGLAYGDHAIITVTKKRLLASEVNSRLHEWFSEDVGILGNIGGTDPDMELVSHPGTLPSTFTEPGDTCLRVQVPASGARLGQYLFHGYDDGEGEWYSQLKPGATYRAEIWMRQENIPNGQVRFLATGPYESLTQSTPWVVTGEWKKYTYTFTGPTYPNPSNGHAAFGIEIPSGAGTVWMDNFLVYRYDADHNYTPFTPKKEFFSELRASMPASGSKPAVRFYTTTYAGHSPMKRLLSNYASSRIDYIYNINPASGQFATIPQVMNWCLATGSSAQDRVVPYITLSEEYTEVEWAQLVEYLGVPYDPASDTPASKPWAHLRYQQRGVGTPWTDEFREVVLELGNETWHQGVGGYGWDGFGRPGYVHFGGTEYGLFANHYFAQGVMTKPWWTTYNLGQKMKFCLNANYDGSETAYGEIAAQKAPSATSYLGHANYVGPKWETGDTPFEVFDDHGVQETLVGGYVTMFPLMEQVAATRDVLKAREAANYGLVAYEGGPSGYYVPGSESDNQKVLISERYGKSLANAVSALDVWLYSSLKGFVHQEYFSFGGGGGWTSHTMPRAGGFRRHTGWLALMMRNLFAPGREMLETSFQSRPSYQRESENIPLMSAYAIKDNQTYSVFVLSRKLDGSHDNADFGDGVTPVAIHLPFNSCESVTRYALTAPDGSPADPRKSNLDAENVVMSSVSLSPSIIAHGSMTIDETSGGVAGGMPGGTVYLYVFENVKGRGSSVVPVHLLLLGN
jgi:hypothetical protein